MASNIFRALPGGRICVQCARGYRRAWEGWIIRQRLSVDHDPRPGVAAQDRERIFTGFVRLPGARPAGGVGLGLAIVRAIAEQHHGSVACVDPPSAGDDGHALTGACFELSLPVG